MKLLYVILLFSFQAIAWADDGDADATRQKLVDEFKKVMSDPAATEKEKADASQLAVLIVDTDSKMLDQKSADIDRLAKIDLDLANSIRVSAPVDSSTAPASLPPPPPAQVPDKAWVKVASFSGSNNKRTEPFVIDSDRWRVTWSSSATAGAIQATAGYVSPDLIGLFSADAHLEGDPDYRVQSVTTKTGSGNDSTEMTGAGTWQIEVTSANVDWSMTIEEFR